LTCVNHKRVYRLYREEELSVGRRGRKRVAREARLPIFALQGPNELWCLDFVSDALAWGRKIRLLPVIDAFTREALAIDVDTSLPWTRVVQVLERRAQRSTRRRHLRGGVSEPWEHPSGLRTLVSAEIA